MDAVAGPGRVRLPERAAWEISGNESESRWTGIFRGLSVGLLRKGDDVERRPAFHRLAVGSFPGDSQPFVEQRRQHGAIDVVVEGMIHRRPSHLLPTIVVPGERFPDQRSGFVMLTNGEGGEARTVFTEVMLKHFTAPSEHHTVAEYADLFAREAKEPAHSRAPDVSARKAATREAMQHWLGVWRDPWFGEASVCMRGDSVRFSAAKSPLMQGTVMQLGERRLIEWDDARVDAQAWLDFAESGKPVVRTMTMAKVDPAADFSFDYEDLAFQRERDCD